MGKLVTVALLATLPAMAAFAHAAVPSLGGWEIEVRLVGIDDGVAYQPRAQTVDLVPVAVCDCPSVPRAQWVWFDTFVRDASGAPVAGVLVVGNVDGGEYPGYVAGRTDAMGVLRVVVPAPSASDVVASLNVGGHDVSASWTSGAPHPDPTRPLVVDGPTDGWSSGTVPLDAGEYYLLQRDINMQSDRSAFATCTHIRRTYTGFGAGEMVSCGAGQGNEMLSVFVATDAAEASVTHPPDSGSPWGYSITIGRSPVGGELQWVLGAANVTLPQRLVYFSPRGMAAPTPGPTGALYVEGGVGLEGYQVSALGAGVGSGRWRASAEVVGDERLVMASVFEFVGGASDARFAKGEQEVRARVDGSAWDANHATVYARGACEGDWSVEVEHAGMKPPNLAIAWGDVPPLSAWAWGALESGSLPLAC